ncbi:unnamed protein product [Fusarium venenatum]|uniref:Uncharacterized protein n=1 Tax=Fusarium venenatum TaxID=56646 RepID=A0A2L2TKH6_9HYPO|nr:LOW QUALITY PROTEIN: uncharacterized protein FVRRES_08690 [Fusarium venenatum]CEI68613.1 unnamed protein product [Fusarium venenatum]
MSIVWRLPIVRPNGYFSLKPHRQRINCSRGHAQRLSYQGYRVLLPHPMWQSRSSMKVAQHNAYVMYILLLWTKAAIRLAEDNRREIVPRRRHTPIQNSLQQPCLRTLARRFGQARRDYAARDAGSVAPPWIPVSGVAGPGIVDPIIYRLNPEHSLNTELAQRAARDKDRHLK